MADDRDAMLLRLPRNVKELVRERAVASKRSLTRQIEYELEHYSAPATPLQPASPTSTS